MCSLLAVCFLLILLPCLHPYHQHKWWEPASSFQVEVSWLYQMPAVVFLNKLCPYLILLAHNEYVLSHLHECHRTLCQIHGWLQYTRYFHDSSDLQLINILKCIFFIKLRCVKLSQHLFQTIFFIFSMPWIPFTFHIFFIIFYFYAYKYIA